MKVPVYNMMGDAVKKQLLPALFGVDINHDLLRQVVNVARANTRRPWAHAQMRGEVRGGGRKPWQQKGTGRARHGSIRSPLWVGGGVTHGPRNDRVLAKKANKKMRRRAFQMALSSKQEDDQLTLVEGWDISKTPKTKRMVEALRAVAKERYGASDAFEKGVLVVIAGDNAKEDRWIRLSARNIPWVAVVHADSLNIIDVLSHRYFLLSKDALSRIDTLFGV